MRLNGADTGREANWTYATSLGRAFAGAILFGLPLLMTMEMWWLGFYLNRPHLFQFMVVNYAVLLGLSHVSGFEPTVSWYDDALDAFTAYGVGITSATIALSLFAIITTAMPISEVIGKIAIQSVPASFGAMLATKQLGGHDDNGKPGERRSYAGQLFLMTAGALFLAFNLAPTDEMIMISFRMSAWHSMVLVLVSILLLHALVYTVGFEGEEQPPGPTGFVAIFFRFSVVGYGIAILVSLYVLWTFGRTGGVSLWQIAAMTAVLGFPSAVGAAIARLVI